jgi:hypothetical protein
MGMARMGGLSGYEPDLQLIPNLHTLPQNVEMFRIRHGCGLHLCSVDAVTFQASTGAHT